MESVRKLMSLPKGREANAGTQRRMSWFGGSDSFAVLKNLCAISERDMPKNISRVLRSFGLKSSSSPVFPTAVSWNIDFVNKPFAVPAPSAVKNTSASVLSQPFEPIPSQSTTAFEWARSSVCPFATTTGPSQMDARATTRYDRGCEFILCDGFSILLFYLFLAACNLPTPNSFRRLSNQVTDV